MFIHLHSSPRIDHSKFEVCVESAYKHTVISIANLQNRRWAHRRTQRHYALSVVVHIIMRASGPMYLLEKKVIKNWHKLYDNIGIYTPHTEYSNSYLII